LTRTPCRSRAIRAGHAYQPSTYRTYLRHRAACPGRGASSTNAVLVPASGVLYEPRRQRRKEKEKKKSGKGKKEKKEKKAKKAKKAKKEKKEKKEKKKRKRDKAPVERSIITGKRIQRKEGSVADRAGEARRAMLLAQMNEGEDEEYAAPKPALSSRQIEAKTRQDAARADPKLMLQMMQQSADAARDTKRRLGALKRGGGGGDSTYDAGFAVAKCGQIDAPNNYKRQRAANEAADYLKPDGNF